MSGAWRLPQGEIVEHGQSLRFTFDGKTYRGLAGDTLASALLANGVHLVGRSFKYHRPRGIMTAGAEEPNALVQLERGNGRSDPNLRATQVELFDGLVATSQNRWPSLSFDVAGAGDRLWPMLPAGFYYKTFMKPAGWWRTVYEPRIRKAAGLGRSPTEPDPDRYLHRHAHCDVLVVGGGPAGIMAAAAAGLAGARVILVDERPELGGSLADDRSAMIDGMRGSDWAAAAATELGRMPELRVLTRSTAFAWYDHNYVGVLERVADHLPVPGDARPRQRLWRIRAKQVVLAAGAIERPLVFPDNDRPGVMLASAARSYLNRWAVRPGARIVLFTNNDSAYATALDLAASGVAVLAIVDSRRDPQGPLPRLAVEAGLSIRDRSAVVGTRGRLRIDQVWMAPLDSQSGVRGLPVPVSCDCLLMSGGWNPSVHLHSQARGRLRFDDGRAAFVPAGGVPGGRTAGACNGASALSDCLSEGARAGAEAAAEAGFAATEPALPEVFETAADRIEPLWVVPTDRPAHKVRAFVDFQNDVTAKDLKLALSEGYRSIEHVKRYTTTGMGTDQGKTSNVNALAIVAAGLGQDIPATGHTTFRPPYTPVTFGAFAGVTAVDGLFDPLRKTPTHAWAEAHGAVFEDVGQWRRARYFPNGSEDMHAAVARECRAARETAGLFDASTLGKIDIQGPDAATFLNRIYTNAWSKLEVGRCRYGLMLRDDGMVMDDGVTARLGPDHFHMTTTSGGAARVFAWLEEWLQCEWPDLRVYCTSVTEQWAAIAVSGPKAREVLAAAGTDIDLGRAAFPHLSFRDGKVAGIAARVFRISFTGELSYEVNVPSGYGTALWEALWEAGQGHGITPYGTEAMHVLRAEKGYIIVGQETDGTVTPVDLGMDWIIGKTKPDFIGKRGLARSDMVKPDRKQLVGLLTRDPAVVLEEGAQIVAQPVQPIPAQMIGHVTSSYASPNLGRSIAMALVEGGRARRGQSLWVAMPGAAIEVEVTSPVFLDPKNERLDG